MSEIIDDYLNERMSLEERSAFEERMAGDETLAKKVREERIVNESIYYASLASLKENVGRDIKKIKYRQGFYFGKNFKLFLLSAVILFTALTSYLLSKEDSIQDISKPFNKETKQVTNAELPKSLEENIQNTSSGGSQKTGKPNKAKSLVLKPEKEPDVINNLPVQQQDQTIFKHPIDSAPSPVKEPEPLKIQKSENIPLNKEEITACNKDIKVITSPSCRKISSGTISVLSDVAEIDGIEINKVSRQHFNGVVKEFHPGTYEVVVSYKNSCSYNKQVTIGSTWCPLNSNYSFNPDYGEKWEIQYEHGDQGILAIFDKLGRVVYESKFGYGNDHWAGTDKNGTLAPIGTYLALITYSDGRKERVELTIVR